MTDSPRVMSTSPRASRRKRAQAFFGACLLALATVGTVVSVAGSSASAAETVNMFDPSDRPDDPVDHDRNSVELGMRFSTDTPGTVTAIRYYKGAGVFPGTKTGHLWSSSGRLRATVTFDDETASGWQVATLSTPGEAPGGLDLHRVVLRTQRGLRVVARLLLRCSVERPLARPGSGKWRLRLR